MKKKGLTFFLSFPLVLLSVSISFADPSSLIVVRDSSSNLWAKTCSGLTCSGWTAITGRFSVQPTLTWDDDIQCYLLVGVGLDGQPWRSTFSAAGTFNNDWTGLGGVTPSPVAAAGGGLFHNFNSHNNNDTTTGVELATTVTDILSFTSYAPYGGFFACTGAGTIEHNRASSSGTDYARVYLAQTSGGTAGGWNFTDVPSGTPAGYTSFPFSVQRWFAVSAGSNSFYMTGNKGGTASGTTTTTAKTGTLTCEFHPYSY